MCSVSFFSKSNNTGEGKAYNGAQAKSDLRNEFYPNSDKLYDNIDSIGTDSTAWVIVYNEVNFMGDSLKIGPGSGGDDQYTELNSIQRGSGRHDDWKDQIKSFVMYDKEPPFWDSPFTYPSYNINTLVGAFNGAYMDNTSGKYAFAYNIEDSVYRIYYPEFVTQSANDVTYYMHLDHENSGGKDNHATFNIIFDNNGCLKDIQNFKLTDSSAYNISSNAVSEIEDLVSLSADLLDVVTDGVATEVADVFNDVFSVSVKLFNFICGELYKFTDNGGKFYFQPVIVHTINRLTCSMVVKEN